MNGALEEDNGPDFPRIWENLYGVFRKVTILEVISEDVCNKNEMHNVYCWKNQKNSK